MRKIDIWLSTENPHKKVEFQKILEPLGFIIHTPAELLNFPSVEETGVTLTENAILKAKALYDVVKQPVIADDTGLEVEALNGAPGVYSARYAGIEGEALANNQLLLKNLASETKRAAKFICIIALIDDKNEITTFEGIATGRITENAQGVGGFGYDALFFSDDLQKTFGDATMEEKNQISHRGRAIAAMLKHPLFLIGGNRKCEL